MAQLPGLVQAGHRQIVGPQSLQLPGHLHRAVAVGVGFHNAQVFHAGACEFPGLPVIMVQGVQVDLRPGPPQDRIFHTWVTFSYLRLKPPGHLLYHKRKRP